MKKAEEVAQSTTAKGKKVKGFTDQERAAMKNRAKELKAEARANKNKADGESDVLAAIAEMTEPDRVMAERLHAIIKASAPALSPCSCSRALPPSALGRDSSSRLVPRP